MYCNKCGKFLVGNENFCSKCGASVEAPVVTASNTTREEMKDDSEKKVETIDIGEDIVWNVKEFPSNAPKKTEDTEFKWRSEDMFLHNEIHKEKEEIAFVEEAIEEENKPKGQEENIEIPSIFKNVESKGVITKNTAPVEVFKEDHIVEIEQPGKSGIALEVDYKEDEGIKVEKVIIDEPELTSAIIANDNVEIKTDKEEKEEKEKELEGKKSLIEEIAPNVVATLENADLAEEKKQIDKFYTFNRKKEAFQELLDKEYERIERKCEPGGFEDDIAEFMDVETGTDVEGTTQLEEMVRARELFFDDPFYVPKDEDKTSKPVEEETPVEEEEIIPSNLEKEEIDDLDDLEEESNVVFEPTKEESLVETVLANIEEEQLQEEEDLKDVSQKETGEIEKEDSEDKEEQPEVAAVIIDPSDKKEKEDTEALAKEFFDGLDEEAKPKGKKFKIAIWTLSIIIVILTALLAIRIVMPNTYISKYMDNVASKVVVFFRDIGGSDSNSNTNNTNSGELVEDKSGLIQLQLDKNYKDNIKTIKYNGEAKYDPETTYTFADLTEAKAIQNNLWYEDNSGKKHYYDEELVGTIIAFESQRTAFINDKDNKVFDIIKKDSVIFNQVVKESTADKKESFDILEIGDIKVAGNAYYVWVFETRDGAKKAKIYEIKQEDKKLIVTSSTDV